MKPDIEYFIAHITGPLEDICKGYCAARYFDPFFVKYEDLVTLREHVLDLSSISLTSLNSACITGIIDTDIEILKHEVMQCEHEFELVDGAEENNRNLEIMNERDRTNNMWK